MTERYMYDKGNGTVRDTVTKTVRFDKMDEFSGAIVASVMNNLAAEWAQNDALRAELQTANAELAAVPVEAIVYLMAEGVSDMWRAMHSDFISEIDAWLDTVEVQP